MDKQEIKQIPLISSEVQMQRLERVINKLMIINVAQTLIIIGLVIYILSVL